MSATLYCLHIHIVFATKQRVSMIKPEWQQQFWAYTSGVVRQLGAFAIAIGGTDDHVHLLIRTTPSLVLSDFVRELKKATNSWVVERHRPEFKWQRGYGAFAVSVTHVPMIEKYIHNQEEHHRHVSYREELQKILVVHGLELDARDVNE